MQELKDLGKIIQETKERFPNEEVAKDIKLKERFKTAFQEYEMNKGETVSFNESTAVVTNQSGQHIYIANQWFVLAMYAVPLVKEVIYYRTITEDIFRTNRELQSYISLHRIDKRTIYKTIQDKKDEGLNNAFSAAASVYCMNTKNPSQNADFLIRFVEDYSWWLGGKAIDRTNDYYVSPALGVLNLVNASQEFVSKLVYAYVTVPSLSEEISEDGGLGNLRMDSVQKPINEKKRLTNGSNILLYGVPGSGKSWTIEHEYCKDSDRVQRLVFHPDYTYSDFVGQILPDVDEDKTVTYKFAPGPFTQILQDAYRDPEHEYNLIIEEINRGNAPAIFGEVFQLLDRKVGTDSLSVSEDSFPPGTSEYEITNENIAVIVYGDKNHKVRIPSNLSILATMNTSDQNVFTLDTAFQRRWRMRLIENSFEYVNPAFAQLPILDTGITWKRFCSIINDRIVGAKAKLASSEDKRLGVFFVQKEDLEFNNSFDCTEEQFIDLKKRDMRDQLDQEEKKHFYSLVEALKQNRRFPEKVVKYLWDDAFKFNREEVFDITLYNNLEKVIHDFIFSTGNGRFKAFKKELVDTLYQAENDAI